MKETVVLNPGFGVGHLVPMVELAKVFLQHGLAVTIVLIKPTTKASEFSAAVARVSASNPSITFHTLPPVEPPADSTGLHPFLQMVDLLRLMNAPLRDFLRSLPSVHALILDMFCPDALDVAAELNIPSYYFFTSGGGDLAIFLHLPTMQAKTNTNFGELGDEPLSFPGVPPLKPTELPKEALNHGSEPCKRLLYMFERMMESNGILVNTFESLEGRALRALKDGLCVPDRAMPPVYFIGPLVSGGGEKKDGEQRHECLEWLDAQPKRSVVFLSFGSMGSFPVEQLKEIAVGLEKSGQRFLWVVRSPRSDDSKNFYDPLPESDLGMILPEGFLERTKDRGLVVKLWAPQVEVLRHEATGAFVTHCGWNSTLEGIAAGLPLVCWPMYAEQRQNKVFIVEEMKLGVEIKGYDEEMVKAEEVEAKVKWVMESEGGQALRERAAAAKESAAAALKKGGSSHAAFLEFLRDLDNDHRTVRA